MIHFHEIEQIGEKGMTEYSVSNNIRENILQLFFQLTRTNNQSSKDFICSLTDKILSSLILNYQHGLISKEEYKEYRIIMYRMIGHTRDIIDGKGEYELSYLLLLRWNVFYPKLAEYALKLFVTSDNLNFIPYGSWKDIKYIYGLNGHSSLVKYGCELMIQQLLLDVENEHPSLVAKWIPRETSKYGGLFDELAVKCFNYYLDTANTPEKRRKAINKAKMEFRKIISTLNRRLDTVQIKQCEHKWSEINPSKQTSLTMHKQKKSFLNIDKNGQQRRTDEDRVCCANNFKSFIESSDEINGQRVHMNDFTKEALKIIQRGQSNSDEATILNAQWKNNSKLTNASSLGKIIAMVDVSDTMIGEPMNAAISLGIRIAENSMFGKRIMTFSSEPKWINLTEQNNFVDMVKTISEFQCDWNLSSNFKNALNLILDVIVEQQLKPEDVEDMALVILSDMQIDYFKTNYTFMELIETQYAEAGMKIWKKPFKMPHIIFWNLRSTTGFPCLSTQKNSTMLSGFSPTLLNHFCDEGINAIHSCTPWSMLKGILNNKRYDPLEKYINELL
jgi:hypothetical protein